MYMYLTSFQDIVDEGHDDPGSNVGHAELPSELVTHREGDGRSNELFDLCQRGFKPTLDGSIESGAVFAEGWSLDRGGGSRHLARHQTVTHTHKSICIATINVK